MDAVLVTTDVERAVVVAGLVTVKVRVFVVVRVVLASQLEAV